MKRRTVRNLAIQPSAWAIVLHVPALAHAHSGGGPMHGLLDGLTHPLTGLDHLAAMIAVGMWAASRGGRAVWLLPTAFVGSMLLGGSLGTSGVALPLVEPGIAVSVLVLGLIVAGAIQTRATASVCMAAMFALFHGHAHGAALPTNASAAAYALGFALSAIALHLIGIGLSFGMMTKARESSRLGRCAGMAMILFGLHLLM